MQLDASNKPPPSLPPQAPRPATAVVPVAPVGYHRAANGGRRHLAGPAPPPPPTQSVIRHEASSAAVCCGVHWGVAGRVYLLLGVVVCAAGLVTLLATGIGRHGPVWIGPIVVCVGLVLLGKGIFDYVRHRIKARADLPDDGGIADDDVVDGGDSMLADGGGGRGFALPFGPRRWRKRRAAHFKYLSSGGSAGNSWATGYSQQGTLQPPPRELVQNASLMLTGNSRWPPSSASANYNRQPLASASSYAGSMRSSVSSSCGHHEPVYFPVLSSTSRLPTPQESPFPSVFSLQDTAGGGGGRGLSSTRRSSGVSAPNLSASRRAPAASASPGSGSAVVVGRSRVRLLPSQGATRLTSHKEEV